MSFVAVAIGSGVAGIGGALISSSAARDAAAQQAAASREAMAMQQQMYNQTREDLAGYRGAGNQALSQMQNADFQRDFSGADFQQDPGYAFRMREASKALERSAAARGSLMSGGFMKGLNQRVQDVASNEYSNAYNRFNADRDRRFGRLSNIAGMGLGAATQTGNAGQNYANQAGNIGMSNANAQGAAGIAQANAWSGALSNLGNNATNYALYSQMFPRGGSTG